jgi:hypothetical protein
MTALVLALLALLAGCAASNAGIRTTEVQSVGGSSVFVVEPVEPALTETGTNVTVIDPDVARACRMVGFVTGIAGRTGFRPPGLSRAGFADGLPREAALNDARNRAGSHDADALVIDADETWEAALPSYASSRVGEDRRVYYLIHARTFHCG